MKNDFSICKALTRSQSEATDVPEVEFISRTVAQILGVVETHQPLWTVGAGQSREEARGLAFITLSLIIGQQLKRLALCFSYALRGRERSKFISLSRGGKSIDILHRK